MASMFGQRPGGLEAILQRPRPSIWQQFRRNPYVFLSRVVYERWLRCATPAQPLSDAISVVCVSDTHNSQPVLPNGDILIHAGDLTQSGSFGETQAALDWLKSQPHRHKIVIAGNHDLLLDPSLDDGPRNSNNKDVGLQRAQLEWGDLTYLQDATTELQCTNGRRIRIYGSPWSCQHGNWAFQYPRSEGKSQWSNAIPNNTDILVTHGPPRAHLDILRLGCTGLLSELWRVQPALHIFGHVHEGYGKEWVDFDCVQEAYERVVIADGGMWNFLRLFGLFLCLCCRLRPLRESKCLLVNPCAVGGLRDEKRREPIKVLI
ncbi:Metallo-dependent phosphatase-like protein [Diaporthe sp. PMI_573]|nr:Metallo-dependent phosphatase-like protein [Diaporthaceae sp. PMI_573]